MTRHAPTLKRDGKIRKLTLLGYSAPQIAQRVHCTPRTVVRARRRAGCSGPSVEPLTSAELAAARRLLEDGCCYPEAARTIGRSPRALRDAFPGFSWSRSEAGQYAGLRSAVARKGLL